MSYYQVINHVGIKNSKDIRIQGFVNHSLKNMLLIQGDNKTPSRLIMSFEKSNNGVISIIEELFFSDYFSVLLQEFEYIANRYDGWAKISLNAMFWDAKSIVITPMIVKKIRDQTINDDYSSFELSGNYLIDSNGNMINKLGKGASRIAFDLGNGNVIKVSYDVSNYGDQCILERKVWNNADDSIKDYLCPLLAYGRLKSGESYNIMPKIELCETTGFYETNGLCETLKEKGLKDLKPDNVGYYKNNPVVLDYGAFYSA